MPAAVLTPFFRDAAIELGSQQWRKKVLPIGDVAYEGRMLHFTPEYLKGLEQAFQTRAYDRVPFQLADAKNTHTNDPERTRGHIVDMRAEQDGLWITLDPSPQGEEVLKQNPYLGVSARIVEDYARSDGKYFPAAVQHVLGTLDPRIPGLGPWQAIEAANTPPDVIDLTAATWAGQGEELIMPELNAAQQANLARLLDVDPAKLDQLVASLGSNGTAAVGDLNGGAEPEVSDDELEALVASMTDEELAALETEYELETAGAAEVTGMSYETQAAIEMANARADETERQLAVIQGRHDAQAYENEKRSLADAGVPPYITELARPLLQGSGHVVDLANGRVDAGQVMRRVLNEYAKMASMLDLGVELGSPMDEPADSGQDTARQQTIDRARAQMFGNGRP
jgi:hypothetical protein